MAKLLNPKVWYLVGVGAAALAVDGVRRVIKRRRQPAGGDGATDDQALAEGIATEAAAAEPKPKRARAKSTPKKAEETRTESILPVAAEPVAVTPVVAAVETFVEPPMPENRFAMDAPVVEDLTRIKGIGPTYARRLAAAGYDSYAAIAATPADTLREIAKAPAMTDIDAWIDAAKALSQ